MMRAVANYFDRLGRSLGEGWNHFWFRPAQPIRVGALRVLAGMLAVYYLASFSGDLVRWFGPSGLLPAETVTEVLTVPGAGAGYYLSPLYYFDAPVALWAFHLAALAAAMALTIGFHSRLANILTLAAVLSYVNRAPMISGLFEPVLAMTLLYLCVAPTGECLSLDAWRRGLGLNLDAEGTRLSWPANLSLRLIQVHLCGLVAMMAINKLYGDAWRDGGAMWLLVAQPESRLINLTLIRSSTYLINFLTHLVIFFELAYAVLIWRRPLRPLMMGLGALVWGLLALVTGYVPFYVSLLAASVAFVEAETLLRLLGGLGDRLPRRAAKPVPAGVKRSPVTA